MLESLKLNIERGHGVHTEHTQIPGPWIPQRAHPDARNLRVHREHTQTRDTSVSTENTPRHQIFGTKEILLPGGCYQVGGLPLGEVKIAAGILAVSF